MCCFFLNVGDLDIFLVYEKEFKERNKLIKKNSRKSEGVMGQGQVGWNRFRDYK